MTRFHLNKWFLDCVTEDGQSMIFYNALLTWFGIKVNYTGHLVFDSKNLIKNHSSLRKTDIPFIKGNQISWSDPEYKIRGIWKAEESPIEKRLFDQKDGYLEWKCWQPRAKVELIINNKRIQGVGYVEEISMTLPPWKISMNDLRWGRYISELDSLVWIHIIGDPECQWIWYQGKPVQNVFISDDKLVLEDLGIVLSLTEKLSLESEEKVLSITNILKKVLPGIRKAIPGKFLFAEENKWLSKGKLSNQSGIINTGWSIHEHVKFKV